MKFKPGDIVFENLPDEWFWYAISTDEIGYKIKDCETSFIFRFHSTEKQTLCTDIFTPYGIELNDHPSNT